LVRGLLSVESCTGQHLKPAMARKPKVAAKKQAAE
jgi:hypothetical protein